MSGSDHCPHGCGEMVPPLGEPLDPTDPYCPVCGHILGRDCDDRCYFEGDRADE